MKVTYSPTTDIEHDGQADRWFTRLWWAPVGGRMRCVGLEVRSIALPGDDPALPYLERPPELTDRRLRGLHFAQIERRHRSFEAIRAMIRRDLPAAVEQWERTGRRGRPSLTDAWVATALDVANAARDRGEPQVPAVRAWAQEQRPGQWGADGPDDSTIGRWLQRARRAQKED